MKSHFTQIGSFVGSGSAIELYNIMQKLSTDASNGEGLLGRLPKRRSRAPRRSIRWLETPNRASKQPRRIGLPKKMYSCLTFAVDDDIISWSAARKRIASCSCLLLFSNWLRNSTTSTLLNWFQHWPLAHLELEVTKEVTLPWVKVYQKILYRSKVTTTLELTYDNMMYIRKLAQQREGSMSFLETRNCFWVVACFSSLRLAAFAWRASLL